MEVAAPYHRPQLDGLRAIAVCGVLWSHWAPPYWQLGVPWGRLGVSLFFVLSGFLITEILLRNRPDSSTAPGTAGRVAAAFFARRFLRIFPLYYAVLVLLILIDFRESRDAWPWFAAYLSNLYFFERGFGSSFSHLWSLAVEEQFYLAWPWVILFLPRRFLPAAIVSTILLGPLTRLTVSAVAPGSDLAFILPTGSCDALGLGALLAWAGRRVALRRMLLRTGWAGLGVAVLLLALPSVCAATVASPLPGPNPRAVEEMIRIGFALGFVAVVAGASDGFSGPGGRILAHRCVTGLGVISYGVYLLHNFAWYAAIVIVSRLGLPPELLEVNSLRITVYALLTLTGAGLSWVLLERPFNALKRHFPYQRPPAGSASRAAGGRVAENRRPGVTERRPGRGHADDEAEPANASCGQP